MKYAIAFLACLGFVEFSEGQTDENFKYVLNNAKEEQIFLLAQIESAQQSSENKGYYIKIIPAQYITLTETIELAPALDGSLDTSNYFVQIEQLEIKEAGKEWKVVSSSEQANAAPSVALCLIKTAPVNQTIERKFYPFKRILDVSNAETIIPAKMLKVDYQVLMEEARLEYIPGDEPPFLEKGEKLIRVEAGYQWEKAKEGYGNF